MGMLSNDGIAIWDKAFPAGHPDVAKALRDYAELLEKADRSAEAKKLREQAEKMDGEMGKP